MSGWDGRLPGQTTPPDDPRADEGLVEALEASIVAIDDWLHTYADDECDSVAVADTRKRISRYGTLAYIAEVQQRNRAALTAARSHGEM